MNKFFLSVIVLCSLVSTSVFTISSEQRREEQRREGWLLGDQYAAQMRQNCNKLLVDQFVLLKKNYLNEAEKYTLSMDLKTYELMKCSDGHLYVPYAYGSDDKK